MVQSIAGLTNIGATTKPTSNDPDKKTKDAAQQFEALMIGQLLKSAHGDSEGWLGAGESDEAGKGAVDYAEQQMARLMAKNGGIGLTNFIVQGLHKKV
jgi:Rod binding domain-containing protein